MSSAKIHPVYGFDVESGAWPKRSPASSWDEQGDFVQEEVKQIVSYITNESSKVGLTNIQAFQLLRMFRVAAATSKNGMKWRSLGQILEVIAVMCSAAVPVFVGIQTQFDKDKNSDHYVFWTLNLLAIGLSLIATLAVAIERVRGMKEQGVIERLEGADIMLELKKFISAATPYGPDYRKQFPKLSAKVADIQHKGTTDLYAANKARYADKIAEQAISAYVMPREAEAEEESPSDPDKEMNSTTGQIPHGNPFNMPYKDDHQTRSPSAPRTPSAQRSESMGVLECSITKTSSGSFGMSINSRNIVISIHPGALAAEAGIEKGDKLIAVNGSTVQGEEELFALLRKAPVDSMVVLSIERGHTPDESGSDDPLSSTAASVGVTAAVASTSQEA